MPRPSWRNANTDLVELLAGVPPRGGRAYERIAFSSPSGGEIRLAWGPVSCAWFGLGHNLSGNSNLLPGMYHAGHARRDHRIGCIGDFTERSCPGPSKLSRTLHEWAQRVVMEGGRTDRSSKSICGPFTSLIQSPVPPHRALSPETISGHRKPLGARPPGTLLMPVVA
jgi:hypothetical protein